MLVARACGYVGPTLRYAVRAFAGPIKSSDRSTSAANTGSRSPGKTRAEKYGFSATRSFVSIVASCSLRKR